MPGEPGIAGVTVKLSGANVPNPLAKVTAADGTYCFDMLVPGDYVVAQSDLPGYLSSTPNHLTVTVNKDADTAGVNFGDWRPASIGDRVWFDADKDGVQDAAEKGIADVKLHLTGTTLSGKAVDKTATTSTSGAYLFYELEPGSYVVDVVDATVPAGYVLTTPPDPKNVTLAYHTEALGVDFGYYWPGSIGDPCATT